MFSITFQATPLCFVCACSVSSYAQQMFLQCFPYHPKQKNDFDLKFKNTLFDTYSTALVEIDNANIFIDSHVHPNERLDLAIVKMSVNVSDTDFDLIYKMKKIEKKWIVIGIILDGIDLIAIFKKQFNKLLKDFDGNLDLAIRNWELDS